MAEIPADLQTAYDYASKGADHWSKEKERLAAQIRALAGDDEDLTVNGVKVYSYAPVDKFRGAEFKKAYPEMVEPFTVDRVVSEFSAELLKAHRPDLYALFQSRQLRKAS